MRADCLFIFLLAIQLVPSQGFIGFIASAISTAVKIGSLAYKIAQATKRRKRLEEERRKREEKEKKQKIEEEKLEAEQDAERIRQMNAEGDSDDEDSSDDEEPAKLADRKQENIESQRKTSSSTAIRAKTNVALKHNRGSKLAAKAGSCIQTGKMQVITSNSGRITIRSCCKSTREAEGPTTPTSSENFLHSVEETWPRHRREPYLLGTKPIEVPQLQRPDYKWQLIR